MIRSEDYKRELIIIFFTHLRMIIAITLMVFAGAILIGLFWPKTYSATGSVLVKTKKPENIPEAMELTFPKFTDVTKEDLHSEIQLLLSADVIGKTITYLEDNKLMFIGKEQSNTASLTPEQRNEIFTKKIYTVKTHLDATPLPASNVIGVTFTGKNPDKAVVLLDTLLEQYLNYRSEIFSPSEEEGFLTDQAKGFKESLDAKEEELLNLIREKRATDPQKEIANNLLLKGDLERTLNQLKSSTIDKKASIEYLEKTLASPDIEYFSFIENNLSLNNFGVALQKVYGDWRDTLRVYRPNSENARELRGEVNDLSRALKAEVEAYKDNQVSQYKAMLRNIADIEGRLEALDEKNTNLQELDFYVQRLTREVNFLKTSHETFEKRKEQARMNRDMGALTKFRYVSIVNRAFPSNGPIFPQAQKIIPFGLLVGFILGCGIAFTLEHFDHTFKKPRDVEVYGGVPVIFCISQLK